MQNSTFQDSFSFCKREILSGGGQGGGSPGEKGREAGGERPGSRILKVAGTGRKQVKFRNISLYFAIDMEQTGEKCYGKGWEAGVKGTGSGSKRYGRREVQTPSVPPPFETLVCEAEISRLLQNFPRLTIFPGPFYTPFTVCQ